MEITGICLGLGATIAAAIAAPALLGAAFFGGTINGITNMAYNAGGDIKPILAFTAGFVGGFVQGAMLEFAPFLAASVGEFVTDELDAMFTAKTLSEFGKDQGLVFFNTFLAGGIGVGLEKWANLRKFDITELQKFFIALDGMQFANIVEEAMGQTW